MSASLFHNKQWGELENWVLFHSISAGLSKRHWFLFDVTRRPTKATLLWDEVDSLQTSKFV
jgi:hypothetical protein